MDLTVQPPNLWRCSITNKTELGKAGGRKEVFGPQKRAGGTHCLSLLSPQQVRDTVPRSTDALQVKAAIPRALRAGK